MKSVIFLSLLSSVAFVAGNGKRECPLIVPRYEWGARSTSLINLPIQPAPFYVIHHTGGNPCTSKYECGKRVREIQNFHLDINGWADIGYNFIVGADGIIFEGRGWGKQGAHAPRYNDKSVSIAIIGNYQNLRVDDIVGNATVDLMNCGVFLGHVSDDYGLIGHNQADPSDPCPGAKLLEQMKEWPHYRS